MDPSDGEPEGVLRKRPNSLCQACQAIFENADLNIAGPDWPLASKDVHHRTALACKTAVNNGCSICLHVWENATQHGQVDILNLDMKGKSFSSFNVRRNGDTVSQCPADAILVIVLTTGPAQARDLDGLETFPVIPASTNTASDESWLHLFKWLKECTEGHASCRHAQNERNFCPARLLDIEQAGDLTVRLHETAASSLKAPYIALSHCWGQSPACKLVDKHSLEDQGLSIPLQDMQAGISAKTLPETYQDAIAAARRLEVRYLWIDSLCILQDSAEDWEKESADMDQVYANAFCTFAATGSVDDRGGLFHERHPSLAQPTKVHPSWHQTSRRSFIVVPVDFWNNMISESHLSSRAWTLQERLLSKRIIHFGQSQLFWECAEADRCETFPSGLPASAQDIETSFKGLDPTVDGKALRLCKDRKDNEPSRKQIDMSESQDGMNGYYIWSRILERYSRTNLTYDKDRLMAIHGLVKRIGAMLDDENVSGLWYNILPSQLLWRVEAYTPTTIFNADDASKSPRDPPSSRPTDWMPSWSWASVKGPIVAPMPLKEESLIEYTMISTDEDETTNALRRNTNLAVKGTLYFSMLGFLPTTDRWALTIFPRGVRMTSHPGSNPGDVRLYPDFNDLEPPGGRDPDARPEAERDQWLPEPPYEHVATVQALAHIDVPVPEWLPMFFPCFCLPVIDTKGSRKKALQPEDKFKLGGVSGLILMPMRPLSGIYQRIGCFDLLGEEDGGLLTESYCNGKIMGKLFMPSSEDYIVII